MMTVERQIPLISVVIPAYNAQDSILESLDSVCGQGFGQFEVVVINDGSTDRTGQIVQEYADRDHRIRVMTISNHGVNFARQLGVQNSGGKYIAFLDADDQLKENALGMYLKEIEGHDVLLANCFMDKVIGKEEYLSLMMDERLPKELWGKLFKRELLTDELMTLPKEIGMGEDYIWNIRISRSVQSVKLIRANYYRYDNQNPNSAIHQFKMSIPYEKLFLDMIYRSLIDQGKTAQEANDLLTVQRFNAFVGLVRSEDVDLKDPFVRDLGHVSEVLRSKRNVVLYTIMRISSIRLKAWLIRLYFRVKPH